METLELISVLIAFIGLLLVVQKNNVNVNLRINENAMKIVQCEKELQKFDKEITEMKQKFENDFLELKHGVDKSMQDTKIELNRNFQIFKDENRSDHGEFYKKLGEIAVNVATIANSLKIHMENGKG